VNDGYAECEQAKLRGNGEGGWSLETEACAPYNTTYTYTSYNFETGMWNNDRGEKFKNGKLVE
jgi:hypothetical protein